ncbi:MAG: amidohydrolase family protein [Woeseiaceae bacterium]|nr:amidohydrolase family protein [Woeseiaceae bacterium]NIP20457.1 amidohydrolase family protein [Woeseiaceae bacterium]NIS89052.1 amidohydrolase family protein [Woeseiaceae bacterium]
MTRICLTISLAFATTADAQVTLTRGTNFSIDVAADGRIVFDLLGEIRIIPDGGGLAREIPGGPVGARYPRWSPDAAAIVFQARDGGQEQLWIYRDAAPAAALLSTGGYFDHYPGWHPDGDRIVFSSDRRESGFDIWELDVPTGLAWRLTDLPGDETEPAWSANGEDLVFIRRFDDEWSLVLRRRGQPEEVLVASESRLSSPSWRPDGSLVTFLRHEDDRIVTEMAILSDPLLVRPLIENEDFFVTPVAWRDRQSMLYASNGFIRERGFNSWTSRNVPFRVIVYPDNATRPAPAVARELPIMNSPEQRWVLRMARLFDGIGGGYQENLDIVVEGGRIAAVEQRKDRPGTIVIDMGDLTALPGFIDAQATLPADAELSLGPALLSFGLTTVVADIEDADRLNETWSGKEMPGPRVLGSEWRLELDAVTAMNLSIDALPTSPRGIRYEDARLATSAEPATVLSGLADSRTPGLADLMASRQAKLLVRGAPSVRRFSEAPKLASHASSIVLGSEANGLGPGIGLHAEFRALEGAGLDTEHVLRTAGINAAAALGLGVQAGRIAPGASADLVLVDGDPLSDLRDTLKVIGVVRNGRFFSAIGLIERRQADGSVE